MQGSVRSIPLQCPQAALSPGECIMQAAPLDDAPSHTSAQEHHTLPERAVALTPHYTNPSLKQAVALMIY